MKKSKVLIVGGGFGTYGHLPAFRQIQNVEIVAVLGSTPKKSRYFAEKFNLAHSYPNLETALRDTDIDVVSFAVPPQVQYELSQLAVAYEKRIVFDKPLTCNYAQAAYLNELCSEKKLQTCINFEFIEIPLFRYLKNIIDSKMYGPILHFFIDWRILTHAYKTKTNSWKTDPALGGGFLKHYFSHTLYLCDWLFGEISNCKLFVDQRLGFGGTLVQGFIETQDGLSGLLSGSCIPYQSVGHRIEVHTENASIILSNQTSDPVRGFELTIHHKDGKAESIQEQALQAGEDSRVPCMVSLFSKFLAGHKVPTVNDGFKVQKLLESAQILK